MSRHPIFDPDPSLDIREGPFIPPRFEFWRLMERIMANTGSVCVWVGIWCAPSSEISSLLTERPSFLSLSNPRWLRRDGSASSVLILDAPRSSTRRDQIDINLLPLVCSYKACGDCTAYGTFPCAW